MALVPIVLIALAKTKKTQTMSDTASFFFINCMSPAVKIDPSTGGGYKCCVGSQVTPAFY